LRIVIAGLGLAGRRLLSHLVANRHELVAIDLNKGVCDFVASSLGVITLCGNATDINILEEANIGRSDVAVGLLRESADNLAFAILAQSAGAARVIARMPNPQYRTAYEHAGVSTIIDTTSLFLDELLLEIERPDIRRLIDFASGRGTVVVVRVTEKSRVAGKTVQEIYADRKQRHSFIIGAVVRSLDNALILPTGVERLRPGDRLLLVCATAAADEAADYFEARRRWRRPIRSRETVRDLDAIDAIVESEQNAPLHSEDADLVGRDRQPPSETRPSESSGGPSPG